MKTSNIVIKSLKHDGKLHRMWHENTVLKQTDEIIIGINDATKVTEGNGKVWTSTEPAIFYFHATLWFNVIALLREGGIHFYSNLSSPFTLEEDTLTYIDYDLDILVTPERDIQLLDEAEYEKHKEKYKYPTEIDHILKEHITLIYELIEKEEVPFTEKFVYYWYNRATM